MTRVGAVPMLQEYSVPREVCVRTEKSTEELPAALGATWVGPLCKCGCLSADCWSVLKRAFSSVSIELGYEVAY